MLNSQPEIRAGLNFTETSTRFISLAELLAAFSHRRPLDIAEASALCHQVLISLSKHLLESDKRSGSSCQTVDLHYPTVSTLYLGGNGAVQIERVKPQQTATPLTDWLSAFGQTLRSHTLVNDSQESEVFQGLIAQLYQPVGELNRRTVKYRIGEWSKTCLALCSRTTDGETKAMLQALQQRAKHIGKSRAYRTELPRKQTRSLQGDIQLRTANTSLESGVQQRLHRLLASDNKDFKDWSNKWQTVNSEYLARNSFKQGSHEITREHKRHYRRSRDSDEREYSSVTLDNLLAKRESSHTSEIPHPTLELKNMKNDPIPSVHIRRTLKTIYSRFLAKPINTLGQELKEKYMGQLKNKSQL